MTIGDRWIAAVAVGCGRLVGGCAGTQSFDNGEDGLESAGNTAPDASADDASVAARDANVGAEVSPGDAASGSAGASATSGTGGDAPDTSSMAMTGTDPTDRGSEDDQTLSGRRFNIGSYEAQSSGLVEGGCLTDAFLLG
jgi:hypothetical protein